MARWFAVLGLLIAGAAIAPNDAQAHPHAWIDLRSTVVLDDQGRIRALEEYWFFDEYYTAYIAEGLSNGDGSSFLTELARTNLDQLAEYGYFTDVRYDDERIGTGPVEQFETGLRDQRLWLQFELPLAKPLDPRQGKVTFAIYDPTYYIEMLYLEGEPIAFRPIDDRCSAEIVPPDPSFEAVSLASALDQTQSGGDGLGALFAETVVVSCQ